MVSSSAIRAGRAFVEVFARDRLTGQLKGIQKRFRRFGQNMTSLGKRLGAAGAAVTAPLIGAVAKFTATGDKLDKMSKRTSISAQSLQELGFAAEQNGSSLDDLGAAAQRMNRRLGRITAGQGEGSQVTAMEELGLSAERLEGLDAEGRLLALSDAMAAMEDPAEAAGLAQRAFGTQVDKLLPLLLQGSDAIGRLRKEFRGLGAAMTEDQVKAAAAMADAWNRVKRQIGAVIVQIGAALAPVLTDIIGTIKPILRAVIEWIKQNKQLVKIVAAVGVGLIALAGVLVTLGVLAASTAAIFGVLAAVIGAVLSPIGLLIGGVVALGAVIVTKTEAGRKALGFLGEKFAALKADALEAFDGIKKAMAAGDFELAAKILWTALRVKWLQGVGWLKGIWFQFKDAFLRGFENMRVAGVTVTANLWAAIRTAWVEGVAFLRDLWTILVTGLKQAWHGLVSVILAGVEGILGAVGKIVPAAKEAAEKVGEARERAQERFDAAGQERTDRIIESDRRRREDLADIEKDRKAAIEGAQAQVDQARRSRQSAFDREQQRREQEIADARAEMERLLQEADEKAQQQAADEEERKKQEEARAGGVQRAAAATKSNKATELRSAEGIAAVANVLRGAAGKSAEEKQADELKTLNATVAGQGRTLKRIEQNSRNRPVPVESPV